MLAVSAVVACGGPLDQAAGGTGTTMDPPVAGSGSGSSADASIGTSSPPDPDTGSTMAGSSSASTGSGSGTAADETSSTGGRMPADWWDPAWGYRAQLTVDDLAASELASHYSVSFTIDVADLMAAGKLRDDVWDLRIVFDDGAAATELDRRIVRAGAQAEVWFATVLPIPDVDDRYWVYYGNPDADAPPAHWVDSMGAEDPSRVYLAADDFSGHDIGTCPDGWGDCGATWQIIDDAGNRQLTSTANGQYLFAGDPDWGDVLVEARVRSTNVDGCPGIAARVEAVQDLVYAGYGCDGSGVPPGSVAVWPRIGGAYSPLVWLPVDPGTAFHTVAMGWVGDHVWLRHDGMSVDDAQVPAEVAATGRVGLFSTYGTVLYADDVIVRRFVDPEPEVSAGPEEPAP